MRVVLITGCGSGIGQELIKTFRDRGAIVVATTRNPRGESECTVDTHADEFSPYPRRLDVTSARSRDAAVRYILERYGRIDVLVNNAGVLAVNAFEDTSEGQARRIFETNYFGPMALARRVLPAMRQQGGGRVINITALGAIASSPFLGTYCASKHALDGATAALDLEVRPFGVRAVSVMPGLFRTELIRKEATEPDTAAYAFEAQRVRAGLIARLCAAPTDFRPLCEAVLHATTSPEPRARYVVGAALAITVREAVELLERLHESERRRLGLES